MNTKMYRFRIGVLLAGIAGLCLSSVALAADTVVVIPMGGGKPMQNVVTVAKTNGKFTDPVAAINSITDASATNPYLLMIAPGQYTLTSALTMKPYVDVTGSGEGVTLLTGAISSTDFHTGAAIVVGANHATLSNLSIKNTGGSNYSLGIYNNALDISARMLQVNVTAIGGEINVGVLNNAASPAMLEVSAIASDSGTTSTNYGVTNLLASAPVMTGVNLLAWGGVHNYGVYNSASAPALTSVNAYAWGGTGDDYGVRNSSSLGVKIRRSTLSGDTDGISNTGASTVGVSQSTIINGASGTGLTCVATDDNAGLELPPGCIP